ncbi:3-oxoacyl-(acyl-carrier-protein) reductase [Fusarium avenaceum]|nr:3-oxoacyl-(acyl-carrier-protein) reductase [Fusarium avenaceum]
MALPLTGKLAIVTGASRGIGLAITKALAARGANLVLAYTSAKSADSTASLASELSSKHSIKVVPVQADLGVPTGPASLISQAAEAFHPLRIDILVNNAGVAHNNKIPDITVDDFTTSFNVNVMGPMLLVQAAQPYLPNDRSGRIINLSSVSASLGFVGQSVYGGTKAALEAMTRTWARELSENATVNAINPGPVRSEMYSRNSDEFKQLIKPFIQNAPLMAARTGVDDPEIVEEAKTAGGRAGEADEIAGIVAMLASPEISTHLQIHSESRLILKNKNQTRDIMETRQADTSDPFEDVLNLEERFYSEGYQQGIKDGVQAGRIEGRSFGMQKGFEKFLESGRLASKAIVWANRMPPKDSASSAGDACTLPALPRNARLEKNINTLYALVEPDTLSTENSDEAVQDFDDRVKRAQGKAKIIEKMAGSAGKETSGASSTP